MRSVLAIALLLGTALTASAQTAAPIRPTKPGEEYKIPPGADPQHVLILRGEFAPGFVGPWQIHPGVEMAYVAQGDLQVTIGNNPPHVYHAGEPLMVPRETPHQSVVVGNSPVVVYVTFVLDQDKPTGTPVPAPAH